MNTEKILDKIKNLLKLAEGTSFEAEAETATLQAQKLIVKYKIPKEILNSLNNKYDTEDIIHCFPGDLKNGPFDYFGENKIEWKCLLAKQLGDMNGIFIYVGNIEENSVKKYYLCGAGEKEDVNIFRYMYCWLADEIDDISKQKVQSLTDLEWITNFCFGVVCKICERLETQREKDIKDTSDTILLRLQENSENQQSKSDSLLLVSTAIQTFKNKAKKAKDFLDSINSNNWEQNENQTKNNQDAFIEGLKAGQKVQLTHELLTKGIERLNEKN